MSSPTVSVIMSIYNNSDTLDIAIQSILNQTYKDFELLIIDDGSTDDTQNILDKYSNNEKIIIYSNKKNIGLTKSLNILIKKTKGQYIARQDADDESLPERLDYQVNYMKKNHSKVSTTMAFKDVHKFLNITPKLRFLIPVSLQIKINNPFIHGTLMIKKDLLEDIGLYDEQFFYSQDYKLFYDLINNKYKIAKLFKPLYILNTKNNISSLKSDEQQYFANCVRKGINP